MSYYGLQKVWKLENSLKDNEIKLISTILLLGFSTSIVLIQSEITGTFIWSTLFDSYEITETGHLNTEEATLPGYVIWFAVLQIVAGVPSDLVPFVPVGVFSITLSSFIFLRKLLKNYIIILFLTIYLLLYTFETGSYSTFAYSWARPLFFICFFLLILYLENPDNKNILSVFLTAFSAIPFLHYASAGWLMIFVFFYLFINILMKRYSEFKKSAILFLFMLVTFVSFSQIIYQSFVPSLYGALFEGVLVDRMYNILFTMESLFIDQDRVRGHYEYSVGRGVHGQVRLVLHLIVAILLTVVGVGVARQISSKNSLSFPSIVFISLSIIIGVHAVTYAIVFNFSTQAFIILGPIAIAIGIQSLKWSDRYLICVISIIILLSILSFRLQMENFINFHLERYSIIEPGGSWIANYKAKNQPNILGSMHLNVIYPNVDREFSYQWIHITNDIYGDLVGGSRVESADYFVIDKQSNEIYSSGTSIREEYAPFRLYSEELNSNSNLNNVYSDGNNTIYQIADDSN